MFIPHTRSAFFYLFRLFSCGFGYKIICLLSNIKELDDTLFVVHQILKILKHFDCVTGYRKQKKNLSSCDLCQFSFFLFVKWKEMLRSNSVRQLYSHDL